MKKILFTGLFLATFFFSCSGNSKETKTPAPMAKPAVGTIHLTKADFLVKVANYETNPNEWKYLGDKPCIIDFYATWCGPCKQIAPILEELALQYKDQINIYKIDTDKEQELASAFGIQSIPTLIFCPLKGQPQMLRGSMPKEEFVKAIQDILLKK